MSINDIRLQVGNMCNSAGGRWTRDEDGVLNSMLFRLYDDAIDNALNAILVASNDLDAAASPREYEAHKRAIRIAIAEVRKLKI